MQPPKPLFTCQHEGAKQCQSGIHISNTNVLILGQGYAEGVNSSLALISTCMLACKEQLWWLHCMRCWQQNPHTV